MNKRDARLVKKQILKCLTTDFKYKSGKITRLNNALFDRKEGYQIYSGITLEMIMDAVVLGIYLALSDTDGPGSEKEPPK